MRVSSEDKDSNYDWYKLDSTIIGVREKQSGGFAIKLYQSGELTSFKKILLKILEHYKYQFMIFDTRSLKDNIKVDSIARHYGGNGHEKSSGYSIYN